MFKESIEKVANFTRPIHTIMRFYGGKQIIPGAATLFFVNGEGYAVTCKHVIEALIASENMQKTLTEFKSERDKLPKDGKFNSYVKGLELKYKFNSETILQMKSTFVDCVDSITGYSWILHPKYDLAIVKFDNYKTLHYSEYAIFRKYPTAIKQGEFLCRLGFPFPEFNNFQYNVTNDDIEWTNTGVKNSPRFPIEGMVTRFLADEGKLYGIEMSTPGLKGQSGGPLFNKDGIVYGMQFSTKHLHLGFDIEDKEILLNNKIKKISNYSFIHLGQCIHAETIKDFLKEHNVNYYEE